MQGIAKVAIGGIRCRVGERTLTENEVPLITKIEDRVVSPSPQPISLVDHTIQDELNANSGKRKKRVDFVYGSLPVKKARTEGIVIYDSRPSTAGKSPSALRRLIRQREQASASFGSAAPVTKDATSSFVTPTLERALKDAPHDNIKTCPPSSRFVVLSSGSVDTDIPISSQVVSPVSSAPTGVNVPAIKPMSDGLPLSVFEPEAGALSATPSQGSSADDFYMSQIVDSATALNVYVPNWNVTNNAWIDNPITCQNLLDHKSEAEVVEVIEIRKHVYDLEAMVAIKVGKDAAERHFLKRAATLDAHIADVRRDMDNNLYPHMLTAIAGRRWVVRHGIRLAVHKCVCSVECRSALGRVISMAIHKGIQQGLEAGVVHGKASRSLTPIEACDPEIEGKYVATVAEFEGNTDATPEFSWFQPSLDQVTTPIYFESGSIDHEMPIFDAIPTICQSAERRGLCLPSSSTLGRAASSAPLHDSSLGVADYQVSTLVLSGDGGPANQLPVV
ncbi:hypothetical protein Tco_1060563 [Tanacetum coccineum]